MAKNGTKNAGTNQAVLDAPRSSRVAADGVTTGEEFAKFMSALMADVIDGRINAGTANAACNAGGKLLKIVEMQYKYGSADDKKRTLKLA